VFTFDGVNRAVAICFARIGFCADLCILSPFLLFERNGNTLNAQEFLEPRSTSFLANATDFDTAK
jgi:hypothetical protein